METITIKVDEDIAKAYRESDLTKKEKINTVIKLFFQPDFSSKSLSELMSEIAENAEQRGLNPEILESILNDDE